MADVIHYQTRFLFRRGYSEAWDRNNPVLMLGEPGFEIDTYKIKIGDGVTAWRDLGYLNGSGTIDTNNDTFEFIDGKLVLKGFVAAGPGFLASKGIDGSLTWTNKIDINMLEIPEGTELIIEDSKN